MLLLGGIAPAHSFGCASPIKPVAYASTEAICALSIFWQLASSRVNPLTSQKCRPTPQPPPWSHSF